MLMNYQAVLIEPFNEGLHYYYMKGLVATRNYREALRYYDELNDIFLSELGTGLSKRFKQLYDIIIADHAKEESKDMEKIMRELSSRHQQNQGFFCSYEIFKYFYELVPKANKDVYYEMINRYGDYFVDAKSHLGPLAMYDAFLTKYVLIPLYNDTKGQINWTGGEPKVN